MFWVTVGALSVSTVCGPSAPDASTSPWVGVLGSVARTSTMPPAPLTSRVTVVTVAGSASVTAYPTPGFMPKVGDTQVREYQKVDGSPSIASGTASGCSLLSPPGGGSIICADAITGTAAGSPAGPSTAGSSTAGAAVAGSSPAGASPPVSSPLPVRSRPCGPPIGGAGAVRALMVFRSDSAERLMKSSKSSGSRRTAAGRTLGGRDGGADAGTDAGMEPSTAVAPPRAEDAAGGSGRRKAGGVGGTAGGGVPGRTWVPDGCPNDRRTDWRRTGWTVGAAPSAPASAAPPRPERAAAPAAEPSALHGPDGIVTDRLTPSSAS